MRSAFLAALIAAPLATHPACAQEPEAALVRVGKAARVLVVEDAAGRALLTISGIQLGEPTGAKRFQGDRRTPEGRYLIDRGNEGSAYWLSLHISYPNAADRAYAAGWGRSAGGDIFIHGQPNSIQNGRVAGDWTDGCIAVSNKEIERLWALVPDGTPIEIAP